MGQESALATPQLLRPDDMVTIRCTYDNGQVHRGQAGLAAPVDVRWDESTTDEMCLGGFQVVDELATP